MASAREGARAGPAAPAAVGRATLVLLEHINLNVPDSAAARA